MTGPATCGNCPIWIGLSDPRSLFVTSDDIVPLYDRYRFPLRQFGVDVRTDW